MVDQFQVVLKAYADAYPQGLTIKARANEIKYFPSRPNVEDAIYQEFVDANGNVDTIEALRGDPENLNMYKTDAFPTKGFFTLQDKNVNEYIKVDEEKKTMTVDFVSIQGVDTQRKQETIFQRLLTVIYGKDDKGNYFFDPVGHIEKAYSLKDTVDIMIESKNAAARDAAGQ